MIMVAWISVWLLTVTHPLGLIIPLLVLSIRASLLGRRPVPPIFGFIAGAFVFMVLFVTINDTHRSLLIGGRTLVFIFLVSHVAVVMQSRASGADRVPAGLGRLYQLAIRSVRHLRELLSDITYMCHLHRLTRVRTRWWFVHDFVGDVRAYTLLVGELVSVVQGFDDLFSARGGFPSPRLWKDPSRMQDMFYVADLLLLVLVCVAATNTSSMLPQWCGSIVQEFGAFFP